MKKLLSTVLAVAMLMTVILAVPAQALGSDANSLYIYSDFEDGTKGANTSTSPMSQWIAGGAGGSYGALKVVSPNPGPGQGGLNIPCAIPVSADDNTLRLSAWVKFEVPAANKKVTFRGAFGVTYTDGSTKDVSYNYKVDYTSQYKLNEWIFGSGEFSTAATAFATEGKTISSIVFKNAIPYAGNVGGTNDIDKTAAPDATSFDYCLDEIRVEKVSKAAVDTTIPFNAPGTNIIETEKSSGNFDSLSPVTGIASRRAGFGWGTTEKKHNIVAYTDTETKAVDEATNTNYLRLTTHDTIALDRYFKDARPTFQINHMYKISYWIKPETTAALTLKPNVLISYYGLKDETTYNNKTSATQYEGAYYDTTHNIGTTYFDKTFSAATLNEWNYVEFYYINEYRGFYEQPITFTLRLANGSSYNGTSGLTICYDQIKIEDLGSLTNGDFETGAVSSTIYKGASAATQPVFGWTYDATKLDVTRVDSDRPGAATGSKALQVTANAAGGNIMQGISLCPNNRYKVSFWAKGVDLAYSLPIDIVLTRDVGGNQADGTQHASEQYVVPKYQTIAGPGEVYNTSVTVDIQRKQAWRLTNEWKYYEGYIDAAFPLAAGKTGTLAGVQAMPRQPWFAFNINGNNAGVTYVLDDVAIECIGSAEAPFAANVKATGSGAPGVDAGLTYNVLPGGINTTDASFVRLLTKVGNNYASLGAFAANETIEIPESAIGKELALELVTVNSNGFVGQSVIVPLAAGNWAKIYVDAATLASRVYASEAKTAKVLYAAYTTDGTTKKLVSSGMADATIAANEKCAITVPAEFSAAGADIVKVMLWDGLTNVTPLCEFVEVPVQ